jgi:molybdopterin-guanine dinucleotide biosynthesis protein A
MYVIVTAGGDVTPQQPLYQAARGGRKAMMDVAGRPMVQWVIDALGSAAAVHHIIVVGLPLETDLVCAVPLTLLPDTGSMLSNIRAGAIEALRQDPDASHAIFCAGDLPALRTEAVDWLICQVGDLSQDLYFTLVERSVMEAQFPRAQFQYTRLKDLQVRSGQLHCFRLKAALEETPLWKRLVESRKASLRQASILGYDTMLFLMLRQLSLKDAEAAVCKRLSVKGKALVCPYPEAGLDIDRPAQLEIVREHLIRRSDHHAANVG